MSKEIWNEETEPDLDVLKVKSEDFASQLTLRDLPIFKKITAEELTSGGWTNKNRDKLAPNIAEFTYRFNVICLWTQRQILSSKKAGKRAELIEHFLWISKKLIVLNNIHACFAIVSALLSQSIYRLSKTWSKVRSREKNMFQKFANLFSSENNWEKLRNFTNSRKIPCIPHIGIYLTDLMQMLGLPKKVLEGLTDLFKNVRLLN
ncbi:hypothetical protein FO519_007817 [Halicephalobus sp. NKZ332]|nr:hypothetical protein FO519_007817 [Halicephalobus sp. NKZ332]